MVLKEHLLQAGHRVEEQYPGELLLHASTLVQLLHTLFSLCSWQVAAPGWQTLRHLDVQTLLGWQTVPDFWMSTVQTLGVRDEDG